MSGKLSTFKYEETGCPCVYSKREKREKEKKIYDVKRKRKGDGSAPEH